MKDRLILEFSDVIPADKVKWIREVMNANKHLYTNKETAYGSNRQGSTIFLSCANNPPSVKEVDAYLLPIFSKLAENIGPIYRTPFMSADSGYEYHIYQVGEKCLEHADTEILLPAVRDSNAVSLIRYATAVIYLTDAETGGEIVFPDAGCSIKPKAGKAVVFPPYGAYAHYVNECVVPREVVVTWFVYNGINARYI